MGTKWLRLLFVAGLVLTAVVVACSHFDSADTVNDASDASDSAAPQDAADAAAALADARFCAAYEAGLCFDFDEQNPNGSFANREAHNGAIKIETSDARSPPNALRIDMNGGAEGSAVAARQLFERPPGGVQVLVVDVDVEVPLFPMSDGGQQPIQFFMAVVASKRKMTLTARPTVLQYIAFSDDGGIIDDTRANGNAGLGPGWNHLQLTISFMAKRVDVTVNSGTAIVAGAVPNNTNQGPFTIELGGLVDIGSTAAAIRFDNVVVSYR